MLHVTILYVKQILAPTIWWDFLKERAKGLRYREHRKGREDWRNIKFEEGI